MRIVSGILLSSWNWNKPIIALEDIETAGKDMVYDWKFIEISN